ncbi:MULTISPECIES: hypothetical protein [Nocardiopsis]|uniref:Uncharacterized protein n=1 Tax=Nocardiopsis lambiniae TaxID=3075539 RepID=A0ABU2M744_9ACTN|nr:MULTISPECIES: hypothetical protein [unclassified Nocardiopsis]MDE3721849.1 hypothetical protein [Nocardiopsis sp. N85]MDT0328471.1 hypothetical protein [Nocardiopsis sp. DSM 44743]
MVEPVDTSEERAHEARGRAAALLTRLVAAESEHGLPPVEWLLDRSGGLHGTASKAGPEAAYAWADFFGAAVREGAPASVHGRPTLLTGLDDYRGVRVVVRTHH